MKGRIEITAREERDDPRIVIEVESADGDSVINGLIEFLKCLKEMEKKVVKK